MHAKSRGVDALALTDHDNTDGLQQAAQTALQQGLYMIPGVEISVSWHYHTVHIIGLNIDTGNQPLQDGLSRLREFREWRAGEIALRLEKHGIKDALPGAMAYAHGPILSRTHFAKFLVKKGYGRDLRHVFRLFLRSGKPGFVTGEWAELEEAVTWIRESGGQAVIAHPARYPFKISRLHQLIGQFKECGGDGIEVISGSHSWEESVTMAACAKRFGLLASAGSDYHGPENPWVELGQLPPLPVGCDPIWADWEINRLPEFEGSVAPGVE